MANCLRSAYKDLFGLYPDAYRKTTEQLRDFFRTRVTGGDKVLSLTVNTFKTLCEFADFEVPVKAVPRGFERDLSEKVENFEMRVFVVPKKV